MIIELGEDRKRHRQKDTELPWRRLAGDVSFAYDRGRAALTETLLVSRVPDLESAS